MKCNSLEELNDLVRKDIAIAMVINTDRVNIIKEVAECVADEKFS